MPRTAFRSSLAALATASLLALAACGGHDKPAAAPSPHPTSASPTATTPAAAPPPTCPLTGKVPGKEQRRVRPVLAVKIDNVDIARPQTGIDRADIVIEETVEGGLTRLFSIFQCDSAPVIGPVRSARTSDSHLLRLLGHPIFGYSGAARRVNAIIHATPGVLALSYDSNGGLYYRNGSRPAPHNVYTSTSTLVKAGLSRNKHLKAPKPLFVYSPRVAGHTAAHGIALRWSSFASASWRWTGKSWARTQNGSPDVLTGGHRVGVDNVVVMRITTKASGLRDVLGNPSPDDVVTGHGRVWVFRNGHVVAGHWTRKHPSSRLRFLSSKGRPIALAPGHTWIELLPPPGTISYH